MEPGVQAMRGYRINEYLIVLSPHAELQNRIMQVTKEFNELYRSSKAAGGKPRLGLVKFTQVEMMEEKIIHRLRSIAMSYHPIKVELKDFGSFPSHSIHINVISKEPIRGLVREIKEVQRLMKLDNDNKPHFIDEPQISIARKLTPWQYENGWLDFSNRHFTGRFIADSMLLLKRRQGELAWQVAQRFEFMNLPVATKQGSFGFL